MSSSAANQTPKLITETSIKDTLPFRLHYNMREPDAKLILPDALKEISGLSLSPDESKLVAVQDEIGEIFFINKQTGEIERNYKFHKEGDYEGVEMVGDTIFIVKSNGKIYEVKNIGEENQETIKYETALNKAYDVEGLSYDKETHRLLLACKAVGDGEETGANIAQKDLHKKIFAFDLTTRTLVSEPIYTLSLPSVLKYLKNNTQIHRYKHIIEDFREDSKEFHFACSGIAINPVTQDLYLLSSKGKLLAVLSPEGEILHMEKLEKSIHRQPEGICFEKDGTLFVSNEGKDSDAVIYQFEYQP